MGFADSQYSQNTSEKFLSKKYTESLYRIEAEQRAVKAQTNEKAAAAVEREEVVDEMAGDMMG